MSSTGKAHNNLLTLSLLGALSLVSPLAIDSYLPAFTRMAADLKTTSAIVSLSLSTYFIGLAFGQFVYGPLLDRFGRKKPIYAGLTIFLAASVGCMLTTNIQVLIALRLLQGLGGCVAQVGAITMVHDFFPVEESAKVFSLLFLFIGASPLLAPTIGSVLTAYLGWRWIFVFMAALVALVLAAIIFLLPEGHEPNPSISLTPARITATYVRILEDRTFLRYTLASALSFAGLFAYIAGAPIVFMEQFHVTAKGFGLIFAFLAAGFIGGSQLNVWLLRHFDSDLLFLCAVRAQAVCGLVFLVGTILGWFGIGGVLAMFFLFLSCVGISNPNGTALALASFSRNAGSASALLGAVQLGIGALISTAIGALNAKNSLPVIEILFATALAGFVLDQLFRPRSNLSEDLQS
jgi:DHA1 family bicyclomycin/chloramphenicol resistance-like MFS transporter